MVTPHLPPEQAANALLPELLREGLIERGHAVRLMAFQPRGDAIPDKPRDHDVHYVRRPRNGWSRRLRFSQMETGLSVFRKTRLAFRDVDVVHLHSNTFMNQVAAALAYRRRVPFILTHYGTEIWHYRRRRIDPFLWMNARASHVTYYSRLLLERSVELGVTPDNRSVIYPPVATHFRAPEAGEREAARRSLGLGDAPLLLNVKRLHPLAGQRYLIEAMPSVLERHPSAKLLIAGEGESREELASSIAGHRLSASVELVGRVDNRKLARYYQAADLFVLPSRLEAFPTVAAEALACGSLVLSADHPGGRELEGLFPEDVTLVPREDVSAIATGINLMLASPRRASETTLRRIEREFRPAAAVERYLELYRQAASRAPSPAAP